MKRMRKVFAILAVISLAAVLAYAQTTEFTYQGSLKDGAAPANANYDFEFALFDAVSGGNQIGATIARNTVLVTNGIFAIKLDFGSQFPGANRYLEIRVRVSGQPSLTTLTPRQLVNSSPYSVKSLSADNATTAVNAATATNATTANNALQLGGVDAGRFVQKDAGGNVAIAGALTVNGIVQSTSGGIRFPDGTTQTSAATGGGSITGVTAGTGLTGGGTTGNVTLNIAPGGVGSTELATNAVTTTKIVDANVTDAKIASVAGSKITGSIITATIPGANVTGTVADATNATTAVNFSGPLVGDVTGTQNATILANNAVTTLKIADSAVTAPKIAAGQVVKNVNGLTDNVTLAAGTNITITPSGNTLTIASTSGGVGGTGTANIIPVWSNGTTLGNSLITQSGGAVQLPTFVSLAPTSSGNGVGFGNPNSETGMTISGASGRADLRYDGTLKLVNGPGGIPPATNGIAITTAGNVGIGTTSPTTKLYVLNSVAGASAITGESSSGPGVYGLSTSSRGVFGESNSGRGVFGQSGSGEGVLGVSTSSAGVSGGSTSGSGVYGESPVSSLTAAGVYGKGTGSGSIGVIGESNIANAVGVFGVSTSPGGVGVYARNNSGGRAIVAEGNVAQNLSGSGFVKAMIYVNQNGTISRCYNGTTNVSTGNCGFVINHPSDGLGLYTINFNFLVNNRFFSITTKQPGLFNTHVSASFTEYSGSTSLLDVKTFITNVMNDSGDDADFIIIVY